MTRYADPTRCLDCRAPIEYAETSCRHCGLPLQGSVAQSLFQTLARADELLVELRALQPAAAPARATAPHPALPQAPLPQAPLTQVPFPRAPLPRPVARQPRAGLSAASVPKILLGLGALCLLVAALVFLAVTWSGMGVSGRTTTLLGLTVVAAGLSWAMARRNLRGAAEALCLVALGLLSLDTFGARSSGWFGDLSTPGFLLVLGTVLVAAGVTAALAVRRTPAGALAGSEVVATIGLATAVSGAVSGDWFSFSAALVVATVASGLAVAALHRVRLRFSAIGGALVTGAAWLTLTVTSLARADWHASLRALWVDYEAWPLLVAIGLVSALALVRRLPVHARVAALAVGQMLLAVLVVIPVDDATETTRALAVLGAVAVVGVLTWCLAKPWALSGALTLAGGWLFLLVVSTRLGVRALGRFVEVASATWSGGSGDLFPASRLDGGPGPWLLPVSVIALIAILVVLARAASALNRLVPPVAGPGAAVALVVALVVTAGAGALSLSPVPVWLVLALLLATATGYTGWGVARRDVVSLLFSGLFLAAAVLLSLHAEWLSVAAFAVAVLLTGLVHLRWQRTDVAALAGALAAASLGSLLWAGGALADSPGQWVALVVVATMAVAVLSAPALPDPLWSCVPAARARTGLELGAGAVAVVAVVAGTSSAPASVVASWAAGYLTLAGLATTAMALLREDRRDLAWLGGGLLAVASWVRLWDVGVRTPEAYTVPSAVVLVLVGLLHLRRHRGSSTMSALAPGLSLALVPSLLWVLREPGTIRSALLGAACLALLAAGLRLRWTAPVLTAATVGSVLVLRLAVPFVDAAVPRWVLIAVAGTALVALGVTWERRVREARGLAGYVRTLR